MVREASPAPETLIRLTRVGLVRARSTCGHQEDRTMSRSTEILLERVDSMLKGSRSGSRHEARVWNLLVLCGPRVERMLRAKKLPDADYDEAYVYTMEALRKGLVTVRSTGSFPGWLAT